MRTALFELASYGEALKAKVVIAGDIFHTWKSSLRFTNFVTGIFKSVFTNRPIVIPGQHDLPEHNIDEIQRSPYFSLVLANAINDLCNQRSWKIKGKLLRLNPYNWGQPLEVNGDIMKLRTSNSIEVAVCHKYIWSEEAKVDQIATEDTRASAIAKQLSYYDLAVFGDNHIPFMRKAKDETTVVNCGTFMRRNQPDREHWPRFTVLFHDGVVKRYPFTFPIYDRFNDAAEEKPKEDNIALGTVLKLIKEIKRNKERPDFKDMVFKAMEIEKVDKGTKALLYQLLETT